MQLPKNAKQVHNGILFNVYQWEQEMFNGTTETFERLTRVPSVEVIASIGEDILTIVQEQPAREGKYPSLPGGRIDPGEEPLAAAKRELLEETNLQKYTLVTQLDEFDFYDKVRKINSHIKNYLVQVSSNSKVSLNNEHVLDGEVVEEHDSFKWFHPSEALTTVTHSNQKETLNKAITYLGLSE